MKSILREWMRNPFGYLFLVLIVIAFAAGALELIALALGIMDEPVLWADYVRMQDLEDLGY